MKKWLIKQWKEENPMIKKSLDELDKEYLNLREAICNTNFYLTTNRHIKIRLDLWCKKLDHIVRDYFWKRNRNSYIKLMYLMCQSEYVIEPFLTLPPQTELPTLQNYQIKALIDRVERNINEKIIKDGLCKECFTKEDNSKVTLSSLKEKSNSNNKCSEQDYDENECEESHEFIRTPLSMKATFQGDNKQNQNHPRVSNYLQNNKIGQNKSKSRVVERSPFKEIKNLINGKNSNVKVSKQSQYIQEKPIINKIHKSNYFSWKANFE